MDAVAAPDGRRHPVFFGACFDRRQQTVHGLQQDIRRLGELHREAGIEHVRRRHALMHEPGLVANMFGKVRQERDNVVLGFPLDLVDALDLESAAVPDRLCRFLGNYAERRLGVAGVGLDLEPDPELVFRLPDGCHRGAGISWNSHGPGLSESPGRGKRRQPRPCGISALPPNTPQARTPPRTVPRWQETAACRPTGPQP